MSPARHEIDPQQADVVLLVLGKHLIVQFGILGALGELGHDGDGVALGELLEEATEFVLFETRATLDDGEIPLFHLAFANGFGKTGRRLGSLGKHHNAARRTVETVHQPEISLAGLVVSLD